MQYSLGSLNISSCVRVHAMQAMGIASINSHVIWALIDIQIIYWVFGKAIFLPGYCPGCFKKEHHYFKGRLNPIHSISEFLADH
jgi:hypothetical protein